MRSPGRAHLRHIPMVPAGPHWSDRDREGGLCPDCYSIRRTCACPSGAFWFWWVFGGGGVEFGFLGGGGGVNPQLDSRSPHQYSPPTPTHPR